MMQRTWRALMPVTLFVPSIGDQPAYRGNIPTVTDLAAGLRRGWPRLLAFSTRYLQGWSFCKHRRQPKIFQPLKGVIVLPSGGGIVVPCRDHRIYAHFSKMAITSP
jgi:hypothetical protein